MTELRLRAALPAEAPEISLLAERSKAYWGYPEEFLDRVRELLTLRREDIRDDRVVVAERDGSVLGFYRLRGDPPDGELADLFVEPRAIGTGLGRALWEHAVRSAREHGFSSLQLESDPNAEGFYLRMGAERVGENEVAPGRQLPVLLLTL